MNVETNIKVREAMEPKVMTINPETKVNTIAKIMVENNIGSLIVSEKDESIGIVTERDIVYGVVARDVKPSEIEAKDIMSSPLTYATPTMLLNQASRLMVKNNIRRLPVIENGKLQGIITSKDILKIAPEMVEILEDLARINASQPFHQDNLDKGTCEICCGYMVSLTEIDGKYICESCKEEVSTTN
jgi:CBS domain-containing protein